MSSESDQPAGADFFVELIAPTPYHKAALTGDIEVAIAAFAQGVPFPTTLDVDPLSDPAEAMSPSSPKAPRAEESPFSPLDLAMIYPCNYRLLTLFAMHGHRPILSESNRHRLRKWLKKQQILQLLAMYRSSLSQDSAPFDPTNPTHLANKKCYKDLLVLSRQLNSIYVTPTTEDSTRTSQPSDHRKTSSTSSNTTKAVQKTVGNDGPGGSVGDCDSMKKTEEEGTRPELEIDCEFVEFSSVSHESDCDHNDSDDEDSYHYKGQSLEGQLDQKEAKVAKVGGGEDEVAQTIPASASGVDYAQIRALLASFADIDSEDDIGPDGDREGGNNDDGDEGFDDVFDENGDELLTGDDYDRILSQLGSQIDSREPQLIDLRKLPMPNRTLLLTATTLMTDVFSCGEEYLANLLGQTITLRCLRLLEDIVQGRFNFESDDDCDGDGDGDGDGDVKVKGDGVARGEDRERVEKEVLAIYNLQHNLNSRGGGLFRRWEVVSDLDMLLSAGLAKE